MEVRVPVSTNANGYIQLIGAKFSITSTVNSGYRRSTRIAPSVDGSDLKIGSNIGE